MKLIVVAALATAITIAVIVFLMSKQTNSGIPNTRFTKFTPDKLDIRVGESTKILFNVQNLETRQIIDAQAIIFTEPSSYQPYLTIQNQTTELPNQHSNDARTGQMQVVIKAVSAPAREAVYTVKEVLFVECKQ